MSFGGENVSKVTLKNFESQEEIDEKKRRRQEEWEKVRKPDDPLDCPEQEKRSLYEQLQAIKDAKEQEFEDEHRLRSSVKGLDEEEVGFLNFVSKRQMEIQKERKSEEDSILREMRDAAVTVTTARTDVKEKSSSGPSCSGVSRKSQQSLLCGAVKRKRSSSPEKKQNSPKRKQNSPDRKQNSSKHRHNSPERKQNSPDRKQSSPERKQDLSKHQQKLPESKQDLSKHQQKSSERKQDLSKHQQNSPERKQNSPKVAPRSPERKQNSPGCSNQADEEESSTTEWTGCSSEPKDVARVLGILPGIGEYSGDSSDTTSSSESDLDDLFPQKTVIRKVHVVESNH